MRDSFGRRVMNVRIPSAADDRFFRRGQPVVMAWGFRNLYGDTRSCSSVAACAWALTAATAR